MTKELFRGKLAEFNDSLLWVTDIRIANFVETGGEK
jgi:hypothetical protein